ncbi:hypothetical protein [Shewanella baltica]|uniref:hypothetical protein n=1 Tax=Shewanella baltica TaxID=62322 RepID=UPI003D7B5FFB
MTRECNDDFTKLKGYILDYRISYNLDNNSYMVSAKRMHKVYFSLVNWHAEYQHQIDFFSKKYTNNKDILLRVSEAISDIGSSNFNWLNGSYKASRVMLRSSIENFVRAISSIDDEVQLTEKNVYKLFDRAHGSNIFNSSVHVNKLYKELHHRYKELCEDTHTASYKNMDKVTSLVDYPKYVEEKSITTENIFIIIAKNILVILCLIFNDLYHKMHHRNRENIINSVQSNYKPLILFSNLCN